MYRLNLLMNGKQREGAQAGYVGSEGFKAQMYRAQLAKWLLLDVESSHKPAIASSIRGLPISLNVGFDNT